MSLSEIDVCNMARFGIRFLQRCKNDTSARVHFNVPLQLKKQYNLFAQSKFDCLA